MTAKEKDANATLSKDHQIKDETKKIQLTKGKVGKPKPTNKVVDEAMLKANNSTKNQSKDAKWNEAMEIQVAKVTQTTELVVSQSDYNTHQSLKQSN